jgi:uncharacterized protein YcbX
VTQFGTVSAVWRYPVKSMSGEQVDEVFVGYAGVYGDRLYAFTHSGAPAFFPYYTGRDRSRMLLYRPRFRHGELAVRPPNAIDALGFGTGLTAIYGSAEDLAVDVTTPDGAVMAVDDPALAAEIGGDTALSLLRCDRAMTDCRPVSLFSLQTAGKLTEEMERPIDPRRFRANLVLDIPGTDGFAEDALVGKTVQVGDRARIAVLDRDTRCAMIGIDPDTAERDRDIPAWVVKAHESRAGVYGAVLAEGIVRPGDAVTIVS